MEVVIEVPMNNTLFVMMLQVGDGRAFNSSIRSFVWLPLPLIRNL